jgi:hypothetical protein
MSDHNLMVIKNIHIIDAQRKPDPKAMTQSILFCKNSML